MTNFDKFWNLYPRKIGKIGVMTKYWPRACRYDSPENIIAGLEAQLPMLQAKEREYIPHPSTWLNEGRWMDEIEQAPLGERPYDRWTAAEKQAEADAVKRMGIDAAIRTKRVLRGDIQRLAAEGYLKPERANNG